MHAFVRVRLSPAALAVTDPRSGPDDAPRDLRELGAGAIIGRSSSCALGLRDPRISEAHAMVSLRGSSLKLLALRGRFAVGDKTVSEVELVPGLVVELARDLALEVVEVVLPSAVLGLEGDGLPRQILGGISSLRAGGPRPELAPGFSSDADALLFNDGLHWTLRLAGQAPSDDRELVAGDTFELGQKTFRVVLVDLDVASHRATLVTGAFDPPLHLVVRYDTVHIHRVGEPSLALDGLLARIVSELATIRLPIGWDALAKDVWADEDDVLALRRRWDTSVARLRRKLREARIRADLVRADGTGNFELFLLPGDTVDDQT
ncbi:MAG: FHA domain-containing protein [Deltaproteobacteria bacterium]|jgi:hypothetical protein|nr:FHA domain-containing protein [Deltaproteobacteria bacterium]